MKRSLTRSRIQKTSPLFNEAERAALDYVTELTRNKRIEPETFDRLRKHYSERKICEIAWLVAREHFYNMTTNLGHPLRHALRHCAQKAEYLSDLSERDA